MLLRDLHVAVFSQSPSPSLSHPSIIHWSPSHSICFRCIPSPLSNIGAVSLRSSTVSRFCIEMYGVVNFELVREKDLFFLKDFHSDSFRDVSGRQVCFCCDVARFRVSYLLGYVAPVPIFLISIHCVNVSSHPWS